MASPTSNLYPANNDSPAREKLLTLRLALLRLPKPLLNMERREYEREQSTPASFSAWLSTTRSSPGCTIFPNLSFALMKL